MKTRIPDYYDNFHCLAGACPHSCCTGWEVVLDEETVHRYQMADGALGERLRAAMAYDGEDVCFPLNGGRCPFLNGDGLCEIHLVWGEAATSVTCREHPRFTEEYGAFQEITLSASCPRANELLLGSTEPLTFLERETDGAEEEGDAWLLWLEPLRDQMMALLRDRRRPLPERLRRFLLVAEAAQEDIETDDMEALMHFSVGSEAESVPETGTDRLTGAALRYLGGLEALEPDWQTLLAAEAAEVPVCSEMLMERIAVYFAFRYLLKAVNDGDLLGRAELCVFALLVIRHLAAVCGLGEALRRFSCEIEHNEEHLEALLDAFRSDAHFALPEFLTALDAW